MPKLYPSRIDSEKLEENLRRLVSVCECGHSDVDHEWIDNYKSKGECEQCLCPKYKFEQTLSIKQHIE